MKRICGYKTDNSQGIGKPQRVKENDLLFAALGQNYKGVFAEAPILKEHPSGKNTFCKALRDGILSTGSALGERGG